MTSIDPRAVSSVTEPLGGERASSDPHPSFWRTAGRRLERLGERLNPILVKESRQALKSRQFVVTFSLLLTCAWAWSLLGVALLSPGVRYAPGGGFMLAGYFVVLCVPVLLIIPFAAFRSIAAEREDGTFELLSITSLSSWQIVTGKLGSAMIQMLVYYSALAPCIAFTYMLRGIDIPSIGLLLFYTFIASVMLSSVGLVVGTLTRIRHWQVVLSVLLLIVLLIFTVYWTFGFLALLSGGGFRGIDDTDFLWTQVAIVSFCVSFTVLFVLMAASNISFAADNRSTRVRAALLLQQFLWVAWMVFFWIRSGDDDVLYIAATVGGVFWAVTGVFLTGETAHLSERVKRALPQSLLSRTFLTWFNPGPATGYLFAVTNLLCLEVTLICVATVAETFNVMGMAGRASHWLAYLPLIVAYVIGYLGMGRLLIVALRCVGRVTMLLAALVQVLFAVAGVAIPIFVVAKLRGYSRMEYDAAQMTNWVWTLNKAATDGMGLYPGVVATVAVAALVVLFVNLSLAAPQTLQVRQATPQRVVEDEYQLHPEKDPRKKRPRNPWSDE